MYIKTFRISMFGNFYHYKPTTENIIKWSQALQQEKYELLPNIVQVPQRIIAGEELIPADPPFEKRLQFVDSESNESILILSDRIDVELRDYETEDFENNHVQNLNMMVKIFRSLSEILQIPEGTRMAYFIDMLIPEHDENQFLNFYQTNNIDLSMNASPDECTEWSHRFNRRINIGFNERIELCNAIFLLEAEKLQINIDNSGNPETVNGLRVSADINTLAEEREERFSREELKCFEEKANIVFLDVTKQIETKLPN